MNSEKVKEIKKALKYNVLSEFMNRLPYADEFNKLKMVSFEDIITLINELESENERLSKENFVLYRDRFTKKELDDISVCRVTNATKELKDRIAELESENERLKTSEFNSCQELDNAFYQIHNLEDRIAELESELEKEQINNLNCDTELQYKEKRITDLLKKQEFYETEKLKQFAERLKEKMGVREYMGVKYKQGVFSDNDIDETLKEFINKGEQK